MTRQGEASRRRRRAARLVCGSVVLSTAALAACGGGSSAAGSARTSSATQAAAVSPAPCAAGAASTAARAAGAVAERIYEGELTGSAVSSDRRQVETYQPLLSALQRGEGAGVREAVAALVFSHTHVVRLRVSSRGRLLADIGGPYILAPVGGPLRAGGRTVGRYLLSVQDDLGYLKLLTRFEAMPVLLRVAGRRVPIEGNVTAAGVPSSGAYRYRGRAYEVYSFKAKAYPSGTLDVSLLVPAVAPTAASCRNVRVAQLTRIAERIWQRFTLVGAPPHSYAVNNAQLTGALTYVRAGGRPVAGSGAQPAHLPTGGVLRLRARSYDVRSFAVRLHGGAARVYLLFPI